ncbi:MULTISPECIES: rhomboid family protein [Bizionia]|uniref:Rhomboid family intramembrane serine protease n=1 Tax=Bizionia algoritergicola TaxID=291187 RepID=A0A5D0QRC5_9FLAO|nr:MULTISPECIES: rhomboid family intramembrane serine protease [Bizionia]OBX21059.1 rhomboid family intramembrane serine protease [Bizionia sp. APA-3]TYB71697.1 rhomboid family intramembrane serine protease [Bizionia algoritergicola]
MANLNQDIRNKLQHLNIFEKLIVVNLAVFIVGLLVTLLFKFDLNWFELPSIFGEFIFQPWSVITYAFVHYDFWHFFFNMIWLYFIGGMFNNMFSKKMGLNVYFLGAISGGLLFLLGYNLFPNLFQSPTRLVGASAAVRALLIFLCAYMPSMDVRFFTFNLKLWYIGAAIVAFDVLGIIAGINDPVSGNAGGNLAHVGGAILGYFYAKQLVKGKDIGKGFEKYMDQFMNLFSKSKKSPLKTVYKKKSGKVAGFSKEEFDQFNNQKKIDVILDKISKSGYDSLTKAEKAFLFKAGK